MVSEETKVKMAASARRRWKTNPPPPPSPEARDRHAARMKELWSDPVWRSQQIERLRESRTPGRESDNTPYGG